MLIAYLGSVFWIKVGWRSLLILLWPPAQQVPHSASGHGRSRDVGAAPCSRSPARASQVAPGQADSGRRKKKAQIDGQHADAITSL